MEKRVHFRSAWLPYLLVAPQLAITIVFFFWPAGQALWYSLLRQDAFGLNVEFAGLENFRFLFNDDAYLAGYSLDRLRELGRVPPGGSVDRAGHTHFREPRPRLDAV